MYSTFLTADIISADLVVTIVTLLVPIYIVATLLYVVRVAKGPTVPDMVLAVDVMAYDLAVFIIILAIIFRSVYLAVGALPLVLWAYILDMFVAKYLEKEKELGE